jgi:hypothetical protein
LKLLGKCTAILYTVFSCSGQDDMVRSYEKDKVPLKGGDLLEELSDY